MYLKLKNKPKIRISENDKIKLRYKQQLNDIKQNYDIEFDIEYFENEDVKSIILYNLKYKNPINNLSITYNNATKKIDSINYEFTQTRLVKNFNHKELIFYLDKKYNIKLLITEINRANENYRKEIEKLNSKFQFLDDNGRAIGKVYQINEMKEEK